MFKRNIFQQFEALRRAYLRGEKLDFENVDASYRNTFRIIFKYRKLINVPALEHKEQIKRQVLAHVERSSSRRNISIKLGKMFWHPRIAVALVLAILVSSIGVTNSLPTAVYAQKESVAYPSGEVLVKNMDEGWQSLYAGYSLKEGDQIKTMEDSWVELRFFDDSIIRLNESSWAKLDKLTAANDPTSMSEAVIDLHVGEIYGKSAYVSGRRSRVVAMLGGIGIDSWGSSFVANIETDGNIEVQALEQGTSLFMEELDTGSYMAKVDLKKAERFAMPTNRVRAMRMAHSPSMLVKNAMSESVEYSDINIENDRWLALNTVLNEEFQKSSSDEAMMLASKRAGALPGSVWYPIKRATEKVQSSMAFGDESINLMRLKQAERRFHETCLLASLGREEEAEGLRDKYEQQISFLVDQAKTQKSFKEKLLSTLLNHHRQLYVSGSYAYMSSLKDVVDSQILTLLEGDNSVARIARSLSFARLQSMQNAIKAKQIEQAQKDLSAYKNYTQKFIFTSNSELPVLINELSNISSQNRNLPEAFDKEFVVLRTNGMTLLNKRLKNVHVFSRENPEIKTVQITWLPSQQEKQKIVFDLSSLAAKVTTKSLNKGDPSVILKNWRLKESQIRQLLEDTRSAINSSMSQREALIMVNDPRNEKVLSILDSRIKALEDKLSELSQELDDVRKNIRSLSKREEIKI